MDQKELGKVEKVTVGYEDHGCFTLYIHITFGAVHQAFGGYRLDEWSKKLDRSVGTAAGMDMLCQLTKLFDVDDLHKAVGKYVWAIRESDSWSSPIIALERPQPDGGATFRVNDWKSQWFGSQP